MADNSQHLSVRIVKVDYYLTKPVAELNDPCYSGFRSSPIYRLPVIRIFGPTLQGAKCCVHVHGVFPYIFIPNWDHELQEKSFYAFAVSLDKAINTSFACSSSKTCHVHRISTISCRPYYGYYEDEKIFLKIEFYNPAIVKRASDLLLNGAVFNKNYQPHEAHVPYILQFFIDNNLYGMSQVMFSSFQTRSVVATETSKQTKMAMEVDSCVKYIIRERTSGDAMPNNPGLAFIWEEERKRRRLQKLESQITPNTSQIRPEGRSTRTEIYYKNKLAEKLKHFVKSNAIEKECTSSIVFHDEEDATTTSQEELDSQAQDILNMLEALAACNSTAEKDKKIILSQPNSPSIVFSEDEYASQEPQPIANIELIRSQPLLKQTAENDSILGDNFSDDDIDEDDHLMLSQSVYRPQREESSSDEFDVEFGNISQLDGSDGYDGVSKSSKKRGNREKKTSRYNLRSANTETQKPKDTKCTPKKQYPQLDISTQISPRTPVGSPSVIQSPTFYPPPETFLTSYVTDSYRSPTTTSPSEKRKNDSRRSYPQLDVNFKKSPKSDIKVEPESDSKRRKLFGGIRKRKIDFDELDTKESTDMSLMTTRWKKMQSLKKEQKSSGSTVKKLCNCDVDYFDTSTRNITYIVPNRDKSQRNFNANALYTVNSEIGSQKYSLKICFDACGNVDKERVLKSLLTKEPVVMVEKMKSSDPSAEELKCTDATIPCDYSDEDQSTMGVNRCDFASSSSKSDAHSDRGNNSLQQLSNESNVSSEVNFWDIGVDLTPKNVLTDDEQSSNALSETVIPSSHSGISIEFDTYDSSPKESERAPIPSQGGESDNNYPTPDFINDEGSFSQTCRYSRIDDEVFSSPKTGHRDKAIIKERLPDLSVFQSTPSIIDDEHLATTTGVFNFETDIKTSYFQQEAGAENMQNKDPLAALYSSINDDEFPDPRAGSNNAKCVNDDSDPVIFSQTSEEDQAFAEVNFSQIMKANATRERVNVEKCDSDSPFKQVQTSKANISSSHKPSDCPRFDFNNSVWDTTESTSKDDDKILSFYEDETVDVVNTAIFSDCKDDTDEVRTPKDEREILTWNNEESLFNERLAGNDELSDTDFRNKSSRRTSEEASSNDDSPPASKKNVLHSTPQNSIGKKKSPSPTYTPILKKLMLKKMNDQTRGARSRLSAQRFQTELFLANIQEEEELKANKVEVEGSTAIDITTSTSVEKNTSVQRSHSSVGSGQIDLTMANTYGFRMSLENLRNVKTETQHQFITVMSAEVFAPTRGDLCPDPEFDPVCCIFYSIFYDNPEVSKLVSGIIMVDNNECPLLDVTRFSCDKQIVKDESELLDNFVTLVEKWDPDIFVGYEIEMLSWGYVIQRAQYLGRNYIAALSRVKEDTLESFKEKTLIEDSEYSDDLKLIGRIVLNVWRLMRHEIALQSYTFENILFHVLHQRVPKHSFNVLTQWWENSLHKWIVIDYYLLRVEGNILLLQQLDFFGRTSELARLFGIQFYEVLSRGSQFRVESMMLRLARKQNFVAVSPSVKQRAKMRAPESLPLIMEPESKFYTDPVIVLDFQSLYPSIIIAYNYCFSTCLGRIEYLAEKETFHFGCVQHTVPIELVLKLQSSLNISPCGVAFVKQNVRRGVLPDMLEEILNTRLMVKKSMKENKDDKTLQRVLHARQLGLKLIANVTYGYTSANFSGRMPCIEVGDSVVSKGRETLERAIEMVSKNEKWAAKVIYGDTDSIFVLVPKRTKEEAFRIGAEIAEVVTNDNPKPVKLKLEKVYQPCILQTKKRYVGYMYESCDQKEPIYDAKGIETVRRDGCPAVAKILEKSLKLLFDYNDVSRVKQYVQHQFAKLVTGRLSIQELTFAREYRGMSNYKPAACVPALQLARQAILRDKRSEPRIKERVRYVLAVGHPGVPLIKSVRTPEEFLNTPGAIINAEYYITRAIIPALERCFTLLGIDVRVWFAELPRKRKAYVPVENNLNNKAYKKKTISHYFATSKCVACEEIAVDKVCTKCQKDPQKLALILGTIINKLQRKHNYLEKICGSCTSRSDTVECCSLDCPVYYHCRQAIKDVEQIPYLEDLQHTFLGLNI